MSEERTLYCTNCGEELLASKTTCPECNKQLKLKESWHKRTIYGTLLLLSVMALLAIMGEPSEGSILQTFMSVLAICGWVVLSVSMYKDRKQVKEVTGWEPWPSSIWFAASIIYAHLGGLSGVIYLAKRKQNVKDWSG